MDGLSVAASVAGILSLGIQVTQSLTDYYEAYKGQKSEIANIAKNLKNLLSVFESLGRQLTDRKFQADENGLLETIEGSIQMCEENIEELQTKIDKFKDSSDIDEIVSNLSLALAVLQQKDIGNVQDNIEDAKAVLDLVRTTQLSSTIRNWLKAPDATTNYNDACKLKHPRTGLWFVKGSYFSTWLVKDKSFLWLNGFAGCGKSNPRIGIAFFFFTFSDDSKQDASAMLRALDLQLSSQLNDNHALLSRLNDRYCNATPPDQDLEDCLHQLVQGFEHVYIILDALDESPRNKNGKNLRRGVLEALVIIQKWSEPGLNLLVTSRDETDIRDVLCDDLQTPPDEIVSMKNASVDSDIASFISGYLKDSRELRKWEKYHDQIEKALTERSNGFGGSNASLGHYLIARRPLTVSELIDANAVELGDNPRLNPDGRLPSEDEIRAVCPGLVEVDVRPDYKTTVRIAHFSVQEYLESERILQQQNAAIFSVRGPEAHAEIASICVTYLLEPALSRESIAEYPLALYAAKTWYKHFRDGDKGKHNAGHQALQLFRNSRGELENWVTIWNVDSYDGRKPDGTVPSSVYYASLLGLSWVLSQLLCENPSESSFSALSIQEISDLVNALGGFYGNALQAASAGGHEQVVKLLLDKSADVNAQGGFYGNALQAASDEGHKQVVKLLLDKSADVNAQGRFYSNALQAASAEGHEQVVKLLLDKGADVNAQGRYFSTAIYIASYRGHEQIMKLLLNRGADVNVQGGYCGNALQAASVAGHKQAVKLLLDKGADVNAQGGHYSNALEAALAEGHKQIVELLLNKGAHRAR
ncbi:hypothetical protein V502_05625 [Pseudogymnoascus sp. VKM F-4520 (FW-2644)]|nr:hypothetical protein V502_05625 [Pseudogymnoascus sp. VKM F-4520 (FW-2644)]